MALSSRDRQTHEGEGGKEDGCESSGHQKLKS